MSELHDILWSICRKLPSDFKPYGRRDRERAEPCADCSCGCFHFRRLAGKVGMDWGVCANLKSPRSGLLTFEHQGCPEFTALAEAPQGQAEAPQGQAEAPQGQAEAPQGEAEAAEEEKVKKQPAEGANDESLTDAAPLRKLRIVEYELLDALEQSQTFDGEPIPVYLDSETGEILRLFSEFDDYGDLIERVEGDPDRYHKIDALDSHESFRIMENFAESLPKSSWKSRLLDALSRSKPFRRFKDVAHSDPKLLDRWLAFQKEALQEYAREWLKSLGIEPQFATAMGPELSDFGGG